MLDLIEPRFGFGRYGSSARASENGEGSVGAMRRPAPAPLPAPVPELPRTPEPEAVAPQPQPEPAPAIHEPVLPHAEPQLFEPPHRESVEEPAAVETAHPAPPHAETPANQPAHAGTSPAEAVHGDARIDDVIESLSAALGAAIHQNPPQGEKQDPGAVFERWTVRPRRTQNQG